MKSKESGGLLSENKYDSKWVIQTKITIDANE